MKPIPYVLSILFALSLTGCSNDDSAHQQRLKDWSAEIEAKLAAQKAETDRLEKLLNEIGTHTALALNTANDATNAVASLRSDVFIASLKPVDSFKVEPEQDGYDILDTENGKFAIRTEEVSPYLDGFEITLKIGNLTSGTFTSSKIDMRWITSTNTPASTREFDISKPLLAGHWNTVQFKVTGITLPQLKKAWLYLTPETVAFK